MTVVLHGEIYHADDHPANYLAQQFANHGFAWAKEIHGSFAILAVDKSADQIVLITDRLNSRRVFASQIEGGICISSHLSAQPWESFELDPTGVAWYIVNRALYNSRTLFRGVSVLKRACIHQLTARGFDAAPYWRDSFDSSPKRANQRQLAAELKTRLIQAMRRRLYDSPNVFLSLSAGYDSTALLGILAYDFAFPMCGVSRMTTGRRRPTAMQVWHDKWPSCAGYSHEIVETYDGNFVAHLRDNAVACLRRHLSWYCADLGAWQRLRLGLRPSSARSCSMATVRVGESVDYPILGMFWRACKSTRRMCCPGYSVNCRKTAGRTSSKA